MRLISKGDLYRRSSRELDGLAAEIRRDIGCCEQRRRRDYAALDDLRKVQGQRRILRPNL
jgi:hypothetical protein